MRKIILTSVLALGITGCTTVPNVDQINADIAKVQSTTQAICGFVPLVSTVANIFAAGSIGPFTDIATAICNAVTKKGFSRRGRVIVINGRAIAIRGHFSR